VTSTTGRAADRTFPTLNAVRGAGALMVVATHSAFNTGEILRGWSGAILGRLDFGVPLFFVLSGFLLSRPFFLAIGRGTQHPSIKHYLWKRFLRIMPLYWLVVTVAMIFTPANHDLGPGVWIRNLTLTQLYAPTLLPEALTQMWSLCTEVLFYLVMPWLAFLLTLTLHGRRLHLPMIWRRCLVLAALGITWQAWFAHIPGSHGHYLQWLPGWLPQFLVGMVFAATSASLALRPRAHVMDRLGSDLAGCWILAAALFAIACTPVAGPLTLAQPLGWEAGTKDVLYTLAAGFLVLPLMFGPEMAGSTRVWLSSRVPVFFGDISYGVYAIHLFVMGVLFRVLDIVPFTGHFLTIFVLTTVITVGLATLSFRYFETPILRFKNVRWMMRKEPAATRSDLEFQERAGRH
jgi:peptidoglycan/LPS O-acetylase OafA/YrhL